MFPWGSGWPPDPAGHLDWGVGTRPQLPAWAEGETEAAGGGRAGPSKSPSLGGDVLAATRAQEGPCPWAPPRTPLPSQHCPTARPISPLGPETSSPLCKAWGWRQGLGPVEGGLSAFPRAPPAGGSRDPPLPAPATAGEFRLGRTHSPGRLGVSDSGDRWGNWACPRVWAGQTGLCSDCWALGGGGEGWGLGVEQGSSSPTPLPVSGQEREQHGR